MNSIGCPFCDKEGFRNNYMRKRHMKIHTTCKTCKKDQGSVSRLKDHIENEHPGIACSECPKTFTSDKLLEKHMKIHNRFPCLQGCKKTFFIKAADRWAHHRTVHKLFHCHECDLTFLRSRDLTQHVKNHRAREEQPLKDPSKMLSMEDVSSAENRPHKCHRCTATFLQRSTLRTHLHRHERLGSLDTITPQLFNNLSDESGESGDEDEESSVYVSAFHTINNTPERLYKIIGAVKADSSIKFGTTSFDYTMVLSRLGLRICQRGYFLGVVEAIIRHVIMSRMIKEKYDGEDLFSITLQNTDALDWPIHSPFYPLKHFDPNIIMDQVNRTMSSQTTLDISGVLKINVTIISMKNDSFGYTFRQVNNYAESLSFYEAKRGIFNPKVPVMFQNDCLLQCIVASKLVKDNQSDYNRMTFYNSPHQCPEFKKQVGMLSQMILSLDFNKPQYIQDLKLVQKCLNETPGYQFQLWIINGTKKNNWIFTGQPHRALENRVYISLHDNHHRLVINPASFFNTKQICPDCHCFYNGDFPHKTCNNKKGICFKCNTPVCKKYKGPVLEKFCDKCLVVYRHSLCFILHTKVCSFQLGCRICGKILLHNELNHAIPESHPCLIANCIHCKDEYDVREGHFCTIQVPKPKTLKAVIPKGKCHRFIFFDIETYTRENDQMLKPYLICAIVCCTKCKDDLLDRSKWKESYDDCVCGQRERVFWIDKLHEFLYFIFWDLKGQKMGLAHTTVLSFNGAQFDNLFILRILVNNGYTPKVVMKGRRILRMELNGVTFKDLRLFVSGALNTLPKSFGFDHIVKSKDWFPHRFVNANNLDHVGAFPEIQFYGIEKFRHKKDVIELQDYLKSQKGAVFDLKATAIKYCLKDCYILAMASVLLDKVCLAQSDDTISILTGSAFTLAGLTMQLYRSKYMPRASIGIVPHHGYSCSTKHSRIACIYFDYLNIQREREGKSLIQHAGNSQKEYQVANYRIDGYSTGELWEFDGCYFHGCGLCFGKQSTMAHPHSRPLTYGNLRDLTWMRKITLTELTGLPVNSVKECKVRDLIQTDPDFKVFHDEQIEAMKYPSNIDPRLALTGGRCESFVMKVVLTQEDITAGRTLEYADFVSLYPSVMLGHRYPTNPHPTVISQFELVNKGLNWGKEELDNVFGLVNCFIIPPNNLFHPILAYKARKKTIYGLCRMCMEMDNQNSCNHTSLERGFKGVFTTPELSLALEHGYIIEKVYSVWDYGPSTTENLFSSMVETLIKGKTESKDYDNATPEYLQNLAKEWKDKLGIIIDPLKIKSDRVMYMLYKILLNSIWGKLAQRSSGRISKFIDNWKELSLVLRDPDIKLEAVHVASEDSVLVSYDSKSSDTLMESHFYNPVIASFVTSYARIKLYNIMHKLGRRVYYTDTDSVIYKKDPKLWNPSLSEFGLLGELTSEIPKDLLITKLIVLAPKCYCYELANKSTRVTKEVVTKMKGFSLSWLFKKGLDDSKAFEALLYSNIENLRRFYMTMAKEESEFVNPECTSQHINNAETAFVRSTLQLQNNLINLDQLPLHLPNPQLVKDVANQTIKASENTLKRLKFRFDKRRLIRRCIGACDVFDGTANVNMDAADFCSVPFGYDEKLI